MVYTVDCYSVSALKNALKNAGEIQNGNYCMVKKKLGEKLSK